SGPVQDAGQVRAQHLPQLLDDLRIAVGRDPEGQVDQGVGGLDGDQEGAAQVLVGRAPEVTGEQVRQAVGDPQVGLGAVAADRYLVAEVDEGEAGRVPLHVQVLADHGVHGV